MTRKISAEQLRRMVREAIVEAKGGAVAKQRVSGWAIVHRSAPNEVVETGDGLLLFSDENEFFVGDYMERRDMDGCRGVRVEVTVKFLDDDD